MTVRLTNTTSASKQVPAPYGNVVASGAYVDIADTREAIQAAFAATHTSMAGWSIYEAPAGTALAPANWNASVRCRAQAAVTLATPGANIGGVAMVAGNRFLTDVQGGALPGSTNAGNGIYVWNSATTPATRSTDLSLGTRVDGLVVKVNEGTDADKLFMCVTEGVVGDAIAFTQSSTTGTDVAKLALYPALAGAGADANKVCAANAGGTALAMRTLNPTGASTPALAVGVSHVNPAAKAVAVHAQVLGGAANAFPGGFTNPATPRSLQITFGAAWDGGIVTVVGTDEADAALSVAFDPAGVLPGGGVVEMHQIFKTVASASKATLVPASVTTADLQTGGDLGLGAVPASGSFYQLVVDGTTLEAATLVDSGKGYTPTTAPNGAHDYNILVNKTSTHTHTNSLT